MIKKLITIFNKFRTKCPVCKGCLSDEDYLYVGPPSKTFVHRKCWHTLNTVEPYKSMTVDYREMLDGVRTPEDWREYQQKTKKMKRNGASGAGRKRGF